MIKPTLLASSVIFISLLLSFSVAQAASPSPSLTPSPTPLATPTESEITESLKERLKDSLEASPSATPASTSYRSLIGTVKDVIQKTLIVDTKDGKKQVTIDDNTTLLRTPGNAEIKQDNIRIDDYVIAIGSKQEEDVLLGKRVIVSTTPLTTTAKKTGYGQITEIKNKTLTITFENQELSLSVDEDTIVKSKDTSSLKLSDIPLNSRIIYTAEITTSGTKETILATTIMLVK